MNEASYDGPLDEIIDIYLEGEYLLKQEYEQRQKTIELNVPSFHIIANESEQIHNHVHAVCARCGIYGHTSKFCTSELPSIDQLQTEIYQCIPEISNTIRKRPYYSSDEFGLVSERAMGLSTTNSFENQKYCLNCGGKHLIDQCDKPKFQNILQQMRSTFLSQQRSRDQSISSRVEREWESIWYS